MDKLEAAAHDERLKAIGQITLNFSMLQWSISYFIWLLIGNNEVSVEQQTLGETITAQLSFQRLLDLLSSLFRHRTTNPEVIEELDALLTRASQARDKRNLVIHSYWVAASSVETIIRCKTTAKQRQGLKHQSEQMGAEDLNDIADFIEEVAYDIQRFAIRMYERHFNKK